MDKPAHSREGGFTLVFRLFGRRLRNMRVEAGLTQESVADRLGVSPQTLRNWERGRHEPSTLHLQRLAELYGSTIDELLEGPWTVSAEDEKSTSVAPVRGHLLAGSDERPSTFQLGSVPLPDSILAEHPDVFGLVVSGESLRPYGIHNGDLVLVDPEVELEEGSVQGLRIGSDLFSFLVRITETGPVELVQRREREITRSREELQIVGRAVWLIRKIE